MNNPYINLAQIHYFIAVAKHLNFTRAAQSLYVSQPSLSKQIAILEEKMGIQLFIRNKRKVELTEAGKVLYEELEGIVHQIDQAISKAKSVEHQESGSLTIGCLEALDTSNFLYDSAHYFKQFYPNINVIFERQPFKILREKLLNDSMDMIITLAYEIEDMKLESRVIFETGNCIWLPTDHPKAHMENLTLCDFKDEKFVQISRNETPNGFMNMITLCQKHGFMPNVVKELPNAESMMMCVESGLGISLLDMSIQVGNKKHLKMIPLSDEKVQVIVAWKKENKNPALKFFVDSLL